MEKAKGGIPMRINGMDSRWRWKQLCLTAGVLLFLIGGGLFLDNHRKNREAEELSQALLIQTEAMIAGETVSPSASGETESAITAKAVSYTHLIQGQSYLQISLPYQLSIQFQLLSCQF